jgi:hypothetical protein
MYASCDTLEIIVFSTFLQPACHTHKKHISGRNVKTHASELCILRGMTFLKGMPMVFPMKVYGSHKNAEVVTQGVGQWGLIVDGTRSCAGDIY